MISLESQKEITKICLRLLSRREHSQQELLHKLTIKGFARAESQIIIANLAEQGWQSDQRFSESYARFRIKKGYGPLKINYELLQRGIKEIDLDSVVIELADSWIELLEQIYNKKYAEDKLLSGDEWLKRSRFLQQRGFSIEMINKLFTHLNLKLIYS